MGQKILDQYTFLNVSRQRKWQLRKKNEGRCVICGKERSKKNNQYCEEHREKLALSKRKYLKIPNPDYRGK